MIVRINSLLNDNKRIPVVKLLRNTTTLDLKESKELTEAIIKSGMQPVFSLNAEQEAKWRELANDAVNWTEISDVTGFSDRLLDKADSFKTFNSVLGGKKIIVSFEVEGSNYAEAIVKLQKMFVDIVN